MSGTELRVWIRLRQRRLDGWKFRRQQTIGEYYVDFYCPAAKLIVEIDGPSHDYSRDAYDMRRQAWLEANGYGVIRFTARDVDHNVADVVDAIRYELEERLKLGFTPRPSRVSFSPSVGCPIPAASGGTSPLRGEDTPPHEWGGAFA